MTASQETLSIDRCPLCGRSHTYDLAVERSAIMKMMVGSYEEEKVSYKRFKRLFTCPTRNEEFEAIITLPEFPSARIETVHVVGPSQGEP